MATAPATPNAPTESAAVSDAIDALMGEEQGQAVVADEPAAEAAETADLPAADEVADENAEPGDEPGDLSELAEEAISYYGLSQADVDRAGDFLPMLLAQMDRQASMLAQGAADQGQQQQTQQTQQTAVAPKAEEPPKPLGELGKFELKINREDHDEGTLSAFDALTEEINNGRQAQNEQFKVLQIMAQALQETHETASSLKQRTESHTATEFASSMDDFFAKLPQEYHEIYGNQPMTQLALNSPLAAARNALIAEMNTLAQFDAKGGRPMRSAQQQAARTLRALHADKEHKVARREADTLVQKQRDRAIARPSSRGKAKGDDLGSRRVRAMASMDPILARLGIEK